MRIKLLLFSLLISSGFLQAQDTIKSLIFSEVRMDEAHWTYAELTNMGTAPVDLSKFEVGEVDPWTNPYAPAANNKVRLPKRTLQPGESFTIARVSDWALYYSTIDIEKAQPVTKKDLWSCDMLLHVDEDDKYGEAGHDSVSVGSEALNCWSGRSCFYLRYFPSATDSIVVDAVNGDFSNSEGRRPNAGPENVAGVVNATGNSILVRKYSIKEGSLDWVKQQGSDIEDSEWLPIPRLQGGLWEAGRRDFWTIGNHLDAKIDAATIKSSTITFDFTTQDADGYYAATVAWGARKEDSIMNQITKVPGIAWHYDWTKSAADSAYSSVRTGDILTLYGCGNTLDRKQFKLTLLPATADDNRVIPMNTLARTKTKTSWNYCGWAFEVTDGISPIDSIKGVTYATRVDSLYKYLEKPATAKWEIVWVDGVARPDLKKGDKLKVTSQSGKVKEYFIKVDKFRPSHNTILSSITWPDIPEDYRGLYGWVGDTIPNFNPTSFSYNLQIPADVDGIPALIAVPTNLDTKIQVQRAKTLNGSLADRTIKFNTTAEDDTSKSVYTIVLEKLKADENIQPYFADPFISQFGFRIMWGTSFVELCNPGNQPLDMSRYMFARGGGAIPSDLLGSNLGTDNWNNRFFKYVPGYKWEDEASWQQQPGILIPDASMNSIVFAGDVFVLGHSGDSNLPAKYKSQMDLNFAANPWGESLGESHCGYGWFTDSYVLFRIDNDSIINGTKAVGNIEDFTVIDTWGAGSQWNIAGTNADQTWSWSRKPNIYKGNPEPGVSFGTTVEDSEWKLRTSAIASKEDPSLGWAEGMYAVMDGIGSHVMDEVTVYKSTIKSTTYIVSEGYSEEETILGVKENTSVDSFLSAIVKVDAGQTLTVMQGDAAISGSTVINDGAILVVVSADEQNTSKYTLIVTAEGLDNNAEITSTLYTVTINGATATIGGFEYGTDVKTILDNIVIPETASNYTIFDAKGNYVPLNSLSYDTIYVNTTATDKIYIEVVAQDGVTTITYQLKPTSTTSDAFVTSDRYAVDQEASSIALVPGGTAVATFLNYLTPATGATWKLIDKMGFERTDAIVFGDDKLIVTSKDGSKQKVYFLSMLSDETTSYLAYVYSNNYTVDQTYNALKITGAKGNTTVVDFKAAVMASFGADYVIYNADGTVKTSADMNEGDYLVVTSSNGKYTAKYAIDVDLTGVKTLTNGNIRMYPNPTTGMVTLDGVKAGSAVKMYNTLGATVMNFTTTSDNETISIENQKAGIYMMVVSSDNEVISNCKLIKK